MKYIVKDKMYGLIVLFVLSLAIGFAGCAEEQEFEPAPDENPSITTLAEASASLKTLRDDSKYGKKAGTYPAESREILDKAIASLSHLILDIHAGTKTLSDSEISAAIASAQSEADRFKGTILTEDLPWNGVPAELYVDGLSDGYIDFGGDKAFTNFGSMSTQAFTVELWVKMTKVRDDIGAVVAAFRENSGVRNGWMINYRNWDFMRVSYATGDDGRGLFEEGTGYMGRGDWLDNGQVKENFDSPWLHIAFVYNDNGRGKLYLNGVIKESRVDWQINDYMKPDYSPYLPMTAFIQRDESGKLSRPVAGYMKHFRIWKTAKTASEVVELMNGKVITGEETDLVCAWPLDETVENDKEIPDLTGRHTAAVRGSYRWVEK